MRIIIKDIPNSFDALLIKELDNGELNITTITKAEADLLTQINTKSLYERKSTDREVTT